MKINTKSQRAKQKPYTVEWNSAVSLEDDKIISIKNPKKLPKKKLTRTNVNLSGKLGYEINTLESQLSF